MRGTINSKNTLMGVHLSEYGGNRDRKRETLFCRKDEPGANPGTCM
ncbi:MAG: hypothetical protein GX045_02385 [Clostridiaceae bacterium]|nr:hypothetical protein [Clostridiaceae bacterium]